MKSLTGNTVAAATFDAAYASTATITIAGNQSAAQAISFYYLDGKGQTTPTSGQTYTFTMTLSVGSATFVIPGITMVIP
ncbi:hypothetical protein FBY31_1818 [Arthrobacter sp. SLBN-100]|nr:hypothetical protein FBY31_1818 [Arthrobacter sp. SLBN-100]